MVRNKNMFGRKLSKIGRNVSLFGRNVNMFGRNVNMVAKNEKRNQCESFKALFKSEHLFKICLSVYF